MVFNLDGVYIWGVCDRIPPIRCIVTKRNALSSYQQAIALLT
ncbi:MAG: hypothetical protein V7L27_25870 [Nostoc sp.]